MRCRDTRITVDCSQNAGLDATSCRCNVETRPTRRRPYSRCNDAADAHDADVAAAADTVDDAAAFGSDSRHFCAISGLSVGKQIGKASPGGRLNVNIARRVALPKARKPRRRSTRFGCQRQIPDQVATAAEMAVEKRAEATAEAAMEVAVEVRAEAAALSAMEVAAEVKAEVAA